MLANATVSQLCELGLSTMAEALADQLQDPGRFAGASRTARKLLYARAPGWIMW